MKVDIDIKLKPGIIDAEGSATKKALHLLGFKDVKEVKVNKSFEVDIDGSREDAKKKAEEMCEKLLANPVIEDYKITLG